MFLQSNHLTLPTQAHDYPEWHKGRDDYALWYIEIQQPELLDYLNQLRQAFSDYLYQPNTRQFHITLFICGFLIPNPAQFDDDFTIQQLQQQLDLLKNAHPKKFSLKTGQIKSFDSALFVEIIDHKNSLSKIRHLFANYHHEIAALDYCPHLTLGLYSDAFPSHEIFSKIEQLPQKSFNISVDHLTFGRYQSKILQGKLFPIHQQPLDSYHIDSEDI